MCSWNSGKIEGKSLVNNHLPHSTSYFLYKLYILLMHVIFPCKKILKNNNKKQYLLKLINFAKLDETFEVALIMPVLPFLKLHLSLMAPVYS